MVVYDIGEDNGCPFCGDNYFNEYIEFDPVRLIGKYSYECPSCGNNDEVHNVLLVEKLVKFILLRGKMIEIKETILNEELLSLMEGKEIEFINGEYDGVKIKVIIKGVKK